MKRVAWPGLLTLAVVCVTVAAPGRGTGEIILFDAPKGAWLGALRDDAPLVILEERDGFRHVRLEGWIMVQAAAPSSDEVRGEAGAAGAPAPAAPAVPAAGTLATVQGVLAPPMGAGGTAGAGVVVLLVAEGDALDAEHRKAGTQCRARLDSKDRAIEALRKDANRALNSSDNFREAASRSDQLKNRLAREQRERQGVIRDCRTKALELFEPSVVQRAISDGSGRFEFGRVAAGRYRVVAFEATGDAPRAWSFACDVKEGGTRVLDPGADRSPVAADWDMR